MIIYLLLHPAQRTTKILWTSGYEFWLINGILVYKFWRRKKIDAFCVLHFFQKISILIHYNNLNIFKLKFTPSAHFNY